MIALHRWASRQDENFITDAFAHLLRHLVAEDDGVGIELLQYLTGKRFPVASSAEIIQVRTQVTVAQGRPDIEISSENHLVYVEAKVESGLGNRQLERYLEELDDRMPPQATTLVVLSRYPVEIPPAISHRVVTRRWYQVAHWLVEKQSDVTNVVNTFLIEQMIEFFGARNITMEKVGPEMLSGLKAFQSLMSMISEAINAQKLTMKDTFGRVWSGYYLDRTKQDFFFGVYHDRPHILVFATNRFPIVADPDERLGFGRAERASYAPNKRIWINELVLDSEEVKFFALSREEQMHRVETFLDLSLIAVQKIQQDQ